MVRLEGEVPTDIPQPVENEPAACDSSCNVVPVTSTAEKTCILTDKVGDDKVSSLEQTYVGIKAKLEEQDSKIDSRFLSRIATSSTQVHPEMKCTSSPVVICFSVYVYYLEKLSSSCCCYCRLLMFILTFIY